MFYNFINFPDLGDSMRDVSFKLEGLALTMLRQYSLEDKEHNEEELREIYLKAALLSLGLDSSSTCELSGIVKKFTNDCAKELYEICSIHKDAPFEFSSEERYRIRQKFMGRANVEPPEGLDKLMSQAKKSIQAKIAEQGDE